MYDVETITKIENSAQNYPLIINNKHQVQPQRDTKTNLENISNNIAEKGIKSKATASINQQSNSLSKQQSMQSSKIKTGIKELEPKTYMKPINRAKKGNRVYLIL